MANETAIAKIDQTKIELLDKAAEQCSVVLEAGGGAMSQTLGLAQAVEQLKELLTDDVMKPIMALQGTATGFLTDKDRNGGYPVDVVRNCMIDAMAKGARPITNEMNIISSRTYLTRAYFERKLDEKLRPENWRLTHDIPKVINANGKVGAVVKSKVWWKDSSGEHEEHLEHAVKGDNYATADTYIGKATRKCGAWLLSNVSGQRFSDGEVDAIDVTPQKPTVKVFSAPAATAEVTGTNPVDIEPGPDPKMAAEQCDAPPMPTPEAFTEEPDELDMGPAKTPEWASVFTKRGYSVEQITAWLVKNSALQEGEALEDVNQKTVGMIKKSTKKMLDSIAAFAKEQG